MKYYEGDPTDINNQFSDARRGAASTDYGSDSFWTVLFGQLYNDPFGAPIEQAGVIANNSATAVAGATKKLFGNLGFWIILAAVGAAAFFYFGGSSLLRRKLA